MAGGRSVRMNGVDKSFILLEGKPLLRWVVDQAHRVSKNIKVVIGKNAAKEVFSAILPSDVSLVNDESDKQGPLVGLLTGLRNLDADYAAFVSCDVPFLNHEVLMYLFEKAEGSDATIPKWPNSYIEPLQAVYFKASVLPAANETLSAHELSIKDMIKRLRNVRYIQIEDIRKIDPDLATFFNLNSQTDLEKASLIVEKKRRLSAA